MGSLTSSDTEPKWDGPLQPLAVVGLSFRFPGGAETTDAFWDMMVSKQSASTETPSDRFNIDAHHDPQARRLGSMSYRGGNFLGGDPVDAFDPLFFSIGATEAQAMDPVHRLTLETTYRALENAGLSMKQVSGTRTAVFAGSSSTDYATILSKDPAIMAKYHATGASSNMMANRVSWFFNLTGPSASVDAACTSSLIALDMVCQSIWSGSVDMGLACGGNIILTPESGMWLDNLGVLSKDSQCFTLDEKANGFSRGEGCGVLVIKPVSAALRDGDTIRAVIRATNSNSNGKTAGLTQPSQEAQFNLIRDTYGKAGLDLSLTRYIEAHGTGTPLGDPIEFGAIGAAFRPYRSTQEPLYVGSVKPNIGHMEGASGIAGVIKAILMLEAGTILPNACFSSMNQKIDSEGLHIAVANEAVPWPSKGLRRISVQSFGFGGSNSHVILDDACGFLRTHGLRGNHNTRPSSDDNDEFNAPQSFTATVTNPDLEKLLVWSSEDESGITRTKESWKEYLSSIQPHENIRQKTRYLADLAYTLASRRTHLSWRAFAVTTDSQSVANLMEGMTGPIRASAEPKLTFLFTGQGSQWFAMGRELIDRYDAFRHSLMDANIFLGYLGCDWDIIGELRQDALQSNVNNALYSQTLCTVLQVALIELLESFGVRPAVVVGHSSGEIAAAFCAGAISRKSAWKLAYWRGVMADKLAKTSTTRGGMMALGMSLNEASVYLSTVAKQLGSDRLVVACVNSPTSVTVSGDSVHLDHLQTLLDQAGGIFYRMLKVDVAYHSHHMNAISDAYLEMILDLEPGHAPNASQTKIAMVSSVTGSWITPDELAQPKYWVRNLVSPVLFLDAVATMFAAGVYDADTPSIIVEVGPHAALQGPSKEILRSIGKDNSSTYISLIIRNVSAVQSFLQVAGYLHCLGYPINLPLVNNETTNDERQGKRSPLRSISNLPQYSFNHCKSYWHESRLSKGYRFRRFGWHDLLGVPDSDWNPLEAKWRHIIRPSDQPWIQDHKVNGNVVFPAAGMFAMVIEAAKQLADSSKELIGFSFKNTTFHSVFKVPAGAAGIEASLHMKPQTTRGQNDKFNGRYDFRLYTFDSSSGEWQEKCLGSVQPVYNTEGEGGLSGAREFREWQDSQHRRYTEVLQRCTTKADVSHVYNGLDEMGYGYGPAFRAITALAHNSNDSAVAEVQTHRHPEQSENHVIHPATLDCIFQVMFMAAVSGGTKKLRLAVPSHFDHLWISSTGLSYPSAEQVKVTATAQRTGLRESKAAIIAVDKAEDKVLLQVKGLCATDVASEQESTTVNDQDATNLCHNLYWKPDLDLMTTEQVYNYCNRSALTNLNDGNGVNGTSEPVEFFTEVDFLVTAYIKRALNTLNAATLKRLQTKGHTMMYLAWMRRRMELLDSGNSPFGKPEWRERLDDSSFIKCTEDRIATTNASGLLYTTIGSNMHELLSGELDPLNLLIHGELAKDHYYGTWDSIPAVKAFGRYLDAMVHKNPGLSILEIGAGTGATTVQLMKTLTTAYDGHEPCPPRFARFDYTDVSPFFFESAENQFRNLGPRMHFKKLDIETDPETQGFEEASYDIIVAAMVLHATSDLTKTLKHCRKLLKTGGKLILWEGTVPDGLRTNFVFGLLEGWWLGAESYRKLSPCVDTQKWNELLEQTGFNGTELVLHDYVDNACHEFSIIISSAIPEQALVPSHLEEQAEITIIHESQQHAIAESLSIGLRERLGTSDIKLSTIDDAAERVSTRYAERKTVLVFLLELDKPTWHDVTSNIFPKIQKLLTTAYKILWVTQDDGPAYSLVDGLSRVLNSEVGNTTMTNLRLHPQVGQEHQFNVHHIVQLCEMVLTSDTIDTEFSEDKDGNLRIPRLMTSRDLNAEIARRTTRRQKLHRSWKGDRPLRLVVGSPGLLDTLHFVEDKDLEQALGPSQVEIAVHSVGLNFKDVLISLGWLNEQTVGCEAAGVVTSLGASAAKGSGLCVGDRVVTLVVDSYRTTARCDWRSVAKIPDGMDLSTAAAIPVNYVTAWHAFYDIARLQKDETVLIHSAAGGTGQAAVQVAQHLGAKVFATVGLESKRELLIQRYGIPEHHIFSSRDASFAPGILRVTGGRGVDVVLNSLAGDSLVASWECVAPYGRFIEIGKKDIMGHSNLPMKMFEKNVSFSAVDISMLNHDRPAVAQKALAHAIDLTAQGAFTPAYPMQLYGISELQKAFRTLQSGKAMGKIVVELRPDDIVETALEPKPTLALDTNATYLIAGGLGGLGRSVTSWFIEHGARNLILLSRSGANNTSASSFINKLEAQGVRIATPICDISDKNALRTIVEDCLVSMPPIKGCIQASMVLHEAPFEALAFDSWQAAIVPKVAGSYNLHEVLPKGMDFFIMFSSIAGICGSRGLSNYAAGNTFQDNLARYRVAQGERATTLDLGPFYEVGWMADKANLQTLYKGVANGPVTQADLFGLLDYFCNPTNQSSEKEALECQTMVLRVITEGQMAFYLEKSMFRCLAADAGIGGCETGTPGLETATSRTGAAAPAGKVDFASLFAGEITLTAAAEAVTEALSQKMAVSLALERHELDASIPIHRYGVDSLVAVELRNWLAKEVRSEVAILDFMGSATISTVSKTAILKSKYRKPEWKS